jgi:hypothetical protein
MKKQSIKGGVRLYSKTGLFSYTVLT